jgi:hypothetical protein
MRKYTSLWALALLAAAGPGRAIELRVEPVSAMPLSPASVAPAAAPVPAASVFTLTLSAPAAAPLLPAGAAVFEAAAPAALAAPAADPAVVSASPAAESTAVAEKAPSRSELVRVHASRILREVFIQQEQEGSLLAPDRRDSSGNIFRYYAPVEVRPELAARVESGLGGFDKAVYATRRFFQFRRGGAEAAWRAWPLSAKLAYLDALEKAVTVERGPTAAWDGKVSLVLKKTSGAPFYATEHPHMEPPPDAYRDAVGARFLQPEIVSDKAHPAASVEEALSRTRGIIAQTGHAGTQYHVFVKAAPDVLLAQMDRIDGALQLFNDALFARAAAGSEQNLAHASLRPWHRGRSERVRRLLAEAAAGAHVPAAEDDDSEKHAYVGFRYWGMEGGNAVVSIELRGVSIPWKRAPQAAVRGAESIPKPERDYDEARAYLTYAALFAQALARGAAPDAGRRSVVLDEAAADDLLAARARVLGVPVGAFDGLAAFARRLNGAKTVPQGWLFPFAAAAPGSPRLQELADELVVLAAHAKAAADAGVDDGVAHRRYLTWSAYSRWSRAYADDQDAHLLGLVRAAAR